MPLFLIYVNQVGEDYKGQNIYEFLFSDTTSKIDGEEWDTFPASSRPKPPHEIFIKEALVLRSELKLDVIQNSDTFAVWDAVDGVIALAWENMSEYEIYPEHRVCFKFGETKEEVENKLYEKDFRFENEKQKSTK